MDDIPETINADERKLRQVLYNLLSNAMKFTADGGAVTLSAKQNGGECVQISVSDTGAGIKPEDLDRIFMPFEQANNAKAGKTTGTGLGLPLSKQFVELHGGKIWVENYEEGCGTTFTIELPCTHH
jgi:signal transduction histidine kinase